MTSGKTVSTIFLAVFVFITLSANRAVADNPGAIVISGNDSLPFGNDVDLMVHALQDSGYGPGVSELNISKMKNASLQNFDGFIREADRWDHDPLYIHISTHGYIGGIILGDAVISSKDLAASIAGSRAKEINITISACYSGSLIEDITAKASEKGKVVTSADAIKESKVDNVSDDPEGGCTYFVKDFAKFLVDPQTDENGDGKNDYDETFKRLDKQGSKKTKASKPQKGNWYQPLCMTTTMEQSEPTAPMSLYRIVIKNP